MSVYWILIEKSQAGKTHARRRGDAHTQPNYKLHAALRHSRLEQISHGSHSTRLTVDENIFQAGNITAALVKKSNSLIASPKKTRNASTATRNAYERQETMNLIKHN